MTTPATGERLYLFDRHAAEHEGVPTWPDVKCRRRAGLRAALIAFENAFYLAPKNDAPDDGRTAE
ncbi:unnamed protein product, partial [Nesidiocoris tenuis]